jgi:hypothetical protein
MAAFLLVASAIAYDEVIAPAIPGGSITPITPVSFGTTGRPGGRAILQPKRQGETVGYVVDFISSFALGETISTAMCLASVYSGTDSFPSAIIDGAATFLGTQVNQGITGGVAGTMYSLLYVVTTNFNQTIEINAILAIVPDSP